MIDQLKEPVAGRICLSLRKMLAQTSAKIPPPTSPQNKNPGYVLPRRVKYIIAVLNRTREFSLEASAVSGDVTDTPELDRYAACYQATKEYSHSGRVYAGL